jgi:hypothetical protein
MHVCPRSTPGPCIIGQSPGITLMPRCSQYATAAGETLDVLRHRLMHPHAADARCCAIVHDALGGLGPGDDHHPVRSAGNRLHVGITAIALEGRHVWIHGEHLVSPSSSTADRSDSPSGDVRCCATRPRPRYAAGRGTRPPSLHGLLGSWHLTPTRLECSSPISQVTVRLSCRARPMGASTTPPSECGGYGTCGYLAGEALSYP